MWLSRDTCKGALPQARNNGRSRLQVGAWKQTFISKRDTPYLKIVRINCNISSYHISYCIQDVLNQQSPVMFWGVWETGFWTGEGQHIREKCLMWQILCDVKSQILWSDYKLHSWNKIALILASTNMLSSLVDGYKNASWWDRTLNLSVLCKALQSFFLCASPPKKKPFAETCGMFLWQYGVAS